MVDVVLPLAKTTFCKFVQPLNKLLPISLHPLPIVAAEALVQPEKTLFLMYCTLSGTSILFRLLQFWKVELFMVSKPLPIDNTVAPLQFMKAEVPTDVVVLGIFIVLIP